MDIESVWGERIGALLSLAGAVAVFTVATLVAAHFGPQDHLCNTVGGQYAQQQDQGTLAHCGVTNLVVQLALLAKWVAAICGVLAAVVLVLSPFTAHDARAVSGHATAADTAPRPAWVTRAPELDRFELAAASIGLLLFASLFLAWYGTGYGGPGPTPLGYAAPDTASGWAETLFNRTVIIIVAAGFLLFVGSKVAGRERPRWGAPALLVGAALTSVLILYRIVSPPWDDRVKAGAWIGFFLSLALTTAASGMYRRGKNHLEFLPTARGAVTRALAKFSEHRAARVTESRPSPAEMSVSGGLDGGHFTESPSTEANPNHAQSSPYAPQSAGPVLPAPPTPASRLSSAKGRRRRWILASLALLTACAAAAAVVIAGSSGTDKEPSPAVSQPGPVHVAVPTPVNFVHMNELVGQPLNGHPECRFVPPPGEEHEKSMFLPADQVGLVCDGESPDAQIGSGATAGSAGPETSECNGSAGNYLCTYQHGGSESLGITILTSGPTLDAARSRLLAVADQISGP